MAPTSTLAERRKTFRAAPRRQWAVQLLRPQGAVAVDSVNISDGGLCVRLPEMLEVRSLVRLLVRAEASAAARAQQALECTGRVAWVVQRLDLRAIPPFLFDVGIEFVNPPHALRQVLGPRGRAAGLPRSTAHAPHVLETATLKGRAHTARLERAPRRPQPWHLMVFVEGVPCLSARYASAAAARAAWAQFKRRNK